MYLHARSRTHTKVHIVCVRERLHDIFAQYIYIQYHSLTSTHTYVYILRYVYILIVTSGYPEVGSKFSMFNPSKG